MLMWFLRGFILVFEGFCMSSSGLHANSDPSTADFRVFSMGNCSIACYAGSRVLLQAVRLCTFRRMFARAL